MYGWYRYESRFALPVFNEVGEIERYNVFNVIMVIRHAKDGKMYLYDIMNIKKETNIFWKSFYNCSDTLINFSASELVFCSICHICFQEISMTNLLL